jgi:hypothetical protein
VTGDGGQQPQAPAVPTDCLCEALDPVTGPVTDIVEGVTEPVGGLLRP